MHLVLASSLAFATAACDVTTSSDGDRVVPKDQPPAKPEFDLNEGGIADFSAINRSSRAETYFSKAYDRADLEAVLLASGASTIEFVQRLGIDLYRVPRAKKEAAVYFTTLSLPPTVFDELWKGTSDGLGDTAQLEGLYFDACPLDDNCEARRVVRPTILVNEAGDRWTLVHEMMHYEFNTQRKTDGSADLTTYENLRKQSTNHVVDLLKTYKDNPNREVLMAAARELDNLSHITYGRLTVKEFEEMTDENLLLDEWALGRLPYVPSRAAANAVWYMNYGRTEGLKLLAPVESTLSSMLDVAQQSGYTDIVDQVRETQSYIADIRSYSREMVKRAERLSGYTLPADDILPRVILASGKVMAVDPTERNCMGSKEERDAWVKDVSRINEAMRF